MAENAATASPAADPIVDPLPEVHTQIDARWVNQLMRPPLTAEGEEIVSAAALGATDQSANTWLQTSCHVVTGTMLINWLANQNPLTKGKLAVPNMDVTKPITPPRVAFALYQDGNAPDQKQFESSTVHPPYIPHVRDGKDPKTWSVDHPRVTAGLKLISLKTDEKPEGEPVKLDGRNLVLMTGANLVVHAVARKALRKEEKKLQKDLELNATQTEALQGKDDPKSLAKRTELERQREKLSKKQETNQAALATNPANDAGKYEPDRVQLNRQKNKELLKRALLRGPVLLNMKISAHFILLIGYRGRNMYVIDPGKVIQKQWWGNTENPATLPAQMVDVPGRTETLVIDGDAEVDLVGAKKEKLAFLDNLLGYESYFFASVGDQLSYNTTPDPPARPVEERDVRRK